MTCLMVGFFPTYLLSACLFYVNDPVVDMRASPSLESEVVSQTILAEKVSVETQIGEWAYILTPDQYPGWVPAKSLISRNKPYKASLKVSRLAAHVYAVKDIKFGPIKTLPFGSKLRLVESSDSRWLKVALPDGKECYIQKGDVCPEKMTFAKKDLAPFSQKFIGLPYTWGGRSSFGYNCSGFVQMLYNQIGVNLPRGSKQQISDPRFKTVPIESAEPGDLVFFGKSKQKIAHVGLYLGNGTFIHSTTRELQPWIRISNLSQFCWSGHKDATYSYRVFRQLVQEP